MLKFILFLSILNLPFCSVKYLKKKHQSSSVQSIKRIFVVINNFQETSQELLLKDLIQNYLSHHTEFIVYKNLTKCKDFTKGQSGRMEFYFTEKQLPNSKINLTLQVKLLDCKDKNILFENSFQKIYKLKKDKDNSLYIENYKQKFGGVIEMNIRPYFHSIQSLFKKLPKPQLNDADIEEKIDIES